MADKEHPEKRDASDPKDQKDISNPKGPALDPEDIDPNDYPPNATPDPQHDTRAVHGDTGGDIMKKLNKEDK